MPTPSDMEAALSLERFARYVIWAENDRERALALYELNARLSESLYIPLQILEVALRNRIHERMSKLHGKGWFEVDDLLKAPNQREQVATAIEDLAREGKGPTPGRVVAALSFSFWTAMFSPAYENLWREGLVEIALRSDGKRLARKDFSRRLNPVRILRNRVAHHEPILHWDLARHHAAIYEVTRWLSPIAAEWAARIDRFPSVLPAGGYVLADVDAAASEE
ncbi:Abi family protein [Salinarimonas sp.]|uniref:Abi family protein n=1 Tax=Salinarimonas sp. TaxID=2766526 RepID=UPI0032D99323